MPGVQALVQFLEAEMTPVRWEDFTVTETRKCIAGTWWERFKAQVQAERDFFVIQALADANCDMFYVAVWYWTLLYLQLDAELQKCQNVEQT